MTVIPCSTPVGRPAFVVNVEVFLEREGRWLFLRRGVGESHAPGVLAGVGGKVEGEDAGPGVLERAARREVAEEVGLDLTGIDLTYVESTCFVTDDGDPVINVVFSGHLPPTAVPTPTSPEEVAALTWLTLPEAQTTPTCPPWLLPTLSRLASK
ncbi:NUDIX hydrolase [Streptosporangium saharense]|uniref:NUDIX hydrolase n=1 Tax=Streptosporangium saharense TaxID=1706840 RepID=UPI0036741CAE